MRRTTARRCPALMTRMRGRRTGSPACPHPGRTRRSCCGCRTATPCRSRLARSRWIGWVRRTQSRLTQAVGPFATVAMDVADFLPDLRWPAQIEIRAGRHVVRPRYEVTQNDRVRIAHVNVERDNLRSILASRRCRRRWDAATSCPSRSCRMARFRSVFQPTPMSTAQTNLPVRLDVFDADGNEAGGAIPWAACRATMTWRWTWTSSA